MFNNPLAVPKFKVEKIFFAQTEKRNEEEKQEIRPRLMLRYRIFSIDFSDKSFIDKIFNGK